MNISGTLNAILSSVVVLPLYGLDLFSTNRVVELLLNAACRSKHCKFQIYSLIFPIALFLSLFSALPGFYIAYNQMQTTLFSKGALFFGINFWLLRVALETNAIKEDVENLSKMVGSLVDADKKAFYGYIDNLSLFKKLVNSSSNRTFCNYYQRLSIYESGDESNSLIRYAKDRNQSAFFSSNLVEANGDGDFYEEEASWNCCIL